MSDVGTDVNIKLVSSIIPIEGERETYELWLRGSFIEKNGSYFLRYEEVLEDKQIKTTVKLHAQKAFIMRSGDLNMRLPLILNYEERGHYESAYGMLPVMTKTNHLQIEHVEHSGTFKTEYDLIIGGQPVGNYTLEISFTEV